MDKKKGFGAVIGRFQTPYLHEGHKSTIDKVLERHENLIICVGVHRGQNTTKNPLDFRTRQLMIQVEYPEAIILPIPDMKSNEKWSQNLDRQIALVVPPMTKVTLYGGRDSFIPYYSGKIETQELESPDVFISATNLRDDVMEKVMNSVQFRAGVMYATGRRYPSPFVTCDLAIVRDSKVLLVQKPDEEGWRFMGGFVDSTDGSIRASASREKDEELGDDLKIGPLTYITDIRVDDWRYASTKEKIFTVFYMAESPSGDPRPNDDIKFAKWVPLCELHAENMEPEHVPLVDALIDHITHKQPQ